MVGRAGDAIMIRSGELRKLQDMAALALGQIRELRKKNIGAFEDLQVFAQEVLKKIEEVEP